MNRFLFILLTVLICGNIKSQQVDGTLRLKSDLLSLPDTAETHSDAVVLFDSTTAKMVFTSGFRVALTRHVRLKILKPSGFSWSYVQISLTTGDKLLRIDGATYNLEDSLVVKTPLSEKQLFSEKTDPFHSTIRFTFPNVREGSVIEYKYSLVKQDIWDFQSMRFQRAIPVRAFTYRASIPAVFNYAVYYTKSDLIRFQQTEEEGRFNGYSTLIRHYEWEGTDLPSFIPEPLMPEGEQSLAGVDFNLMSVSYPGAQAYLASPSYEALADEFLDRSVVGKQLNDVLLFSGQVSRVCNGIIDPVKRMKAVYAYVQQHMQWNGYDQLWPDRSLLRAGNEGTGTSAEINLILVNMLRTAGIQADPVVLNTRNQGPVITRAAVVNRLNYLVCCATINGSDFLLDATDKYRPAGMLPFKCLNDKGWVLSRSNGRWVKLNSKENFAISEFFDLQMDTSHRLFGKVYFTFGGFDAMRIRKAFFRDGPGSFTESLETKDFQTGSPVFLNPDSLHLPLRVEMDVSSESWVKSGDKRIFFKPLISFFSPVEVTWIQDERIYPIDFGCSRTMSVKGRIRLPEGYSLEELPVPIQIRLPEKEISFVYGVSQTKEQISFSAELNFGETYLAAEEYPTLRALLLQAYGKINEMVVCKPD
jgi:hypothetical protein